MPAPLLAIRFITGSPLGGDFIGLESTCRQPVPMSEMHANATPRIRTAKGRIFIGAFARENMLLVSRRHHIGISIAAAREGSLSIS